MWEQSVAILNPVEALKNSTYEDKKKKHKRPKEYEVCERLSKLVSVDDDWYPNLCGNKVVVTLTLFGGFVKFNAYGDDDTGVEMECPVHSKAVFNTWKKYIYDKMPEVVNKKWFFEHGFYYA